MGGSLGDQGGSPRARWQIPSEPSARPPTPSCARWNKYVAFGLSGLLQPGLCRLEQTDGIVDLTPTGALAVLEAVEPVRLLQAVITLAWDTLDRGRALLDDEAMWTDLERRMGVIRP